MALKIAMIQGAAAVAPRGAEDAYAAVAGGQQRPGRADPVAGALKAWNVVATVAGDGLVVLRQLLLLVMVVALLRRLLLLLLPR